MTTLGAGSSLAAFLVSPLADFLPNTVRVPLSTAIAGASFLPQGKQWLDEARAWAKARHAIRAELDDFERQLAEFDERPPQRRPVVSDHVARSVAILGPGKLARSGDGMRIRSRVGMQMIHVTSWGGSQTTYLIQTAWVDRPPAGIRHGRLRCAACGAMVRFRLYSEADAKMRRQRWLIITLVAATALTVIAAILVGGDSDFIDRIAPELGAVAAVVILTLMVFGHLLRIEDGVRGARGRDHDNGPHLFKRLNPIGAWLKPVAVDSPVSAEIVFDDSDAPTSERQDTE